MSPMNNRLLVPRKTPGLLDLVPGAAAAYSLRSLSNSYADPVVTVRRSSDDAEEDFTAAQVADGTLAAFCGAGDGFVKQWWDQSGNARHASQTTAGYQPKIVSSGAVITADGNACIQFDGSDDRLRFATAIDASTYTCISVFNRATTTSNVCVLGQESSSLPYAIIATGSLLYGANGTGGSALYSGVNANAIPTDKQVVATQDSSGPRIWVNSAEIALPVTGSLSSSSSFTELGAKRFSTITYSNASFSDVVVYGEVLADNARQTAEAYLAWSHS